MVQQNLIWRSCRMGRSLVELNGDLSNAFGCTNHEALDKVVRTDLVEAKNVTFAEQRYRWAFTFLPCREGVICLRVNSGNLMGDPFAVEAFKSRVPHLRVEQVPHWRRWL